jgi:flagellar basal body L-ring protein FlgH
MRIILAIYLAIGLFAGNVYSGNEVKQRSLFTDVKAHKVGDLVTVLIVEESQASNRAKTSTQKKSDAKTTGTALGRLTLFQPGIFPAATRCNSTARGKQKKRAL